MSISEEEWRFENERLQKVLKEARRQLEENRALKERLKRDGIETQKEMWQDIGSVAKDNGLDQLVDFMQLIDTMKIQKSSHEFIKRQEEKFEKILLSPYFGRMDFIEDGEENVEMCYIGISNLITDDYEFLVYDWRAPISSMYYECEIGDASYESPEGIIRGKLTLKRHYKIHNGKIEYMFDSSLKIDDEILQALLGKSTDSKMKTIVTTIQREQNKVIRNEEYRNLIVQGPAGSGKTSVALHRVAYLLYKHRDTIKPENIVIFSPNDVFNDYISNVLPELGEENMLQTTFRQYMNKALGNDFRKESYSEMMEYILEAKNKQAYRRRINNIKFKSSVTFIHILKRYVFHLEKEYGRFKDLVIKGQLIASSDGIKELFFKDYAHLPLKRRLQKLKNRILFLIEPYEKKLIETLSKEMHESDSSMNQAESMKRSTALVKDEMKEIYDEIDKMTAFDLIEIYKNLFENLEFFSAGLIDHGSDIKLNEIKKYTLENLQAKVLYYEDQPPLLYLKGALGDLPETSDIKYVIIDEAQDYTPLQYEIFHQLFKSANITILGDLNQSINPYMNVGDYENLVHIFAKEDTCRIDLTKSYRSTMEIAQFTSRLLNKNITHEWIERSGDQPKVIGFFDTEEIRKRLIQDIEDYKERGYKSIGIITRTVKEAKEVYEFLKDKADVHVIQKDDDEYISGAVIIPSYLAKGLEFDVVLIYNAGNENYNCEEERLLLYTACTRALHVLHIYYTGKLTPLLREVEIQEAEFLS